MLKSQRLKENLNSLMKEQKLAVLATYHDEETYTNLVGFAASNDLRSIYFVTPVATRKYSYLTGSGKASMMIDNRTNTANDFKDAMAVNANGKVVVAEKTDELKKLYIEKHPYLQDFLESPSSALIRLDVDRYIIASSFQNVMELDMT
ncbi:pyridoxamine 5'-phosphate oxidase family protein [Methanolobus sp. WCC5]|uniref:pyridoxamine 5'-phosphate oxidase family protein n=1 Tax=Methanolobus sp. WCC5 TaxID=3125785 RepID=UPI0032455498